MFFDAICEKQHHVDFYHHPQIKTFDSLSN